MYKLRGPLALALALAAGTVMLLWVLTPYYFLFLTALLPSGASLNGLRPSAPLTFENFSAVIFGFNRIWPYMRNTAIVSTGSTLLALVIALPAGYGLSRLSHLRSARVAYLSMFVFRMLPPITLVIPYFIVFSRAHQLDTRSGLIVATVPLLLPFAIWTIKAFFDGVPIVIEEAARLDGCGTLGTLWRVVLPVVGQGIAATTVLVFLQAYVEYMFATTLSKSVAVTLPAYLPSFQNDYFVYVGNMMAATIISTIPMVFLYSYAQRYMQRMSMAGTH